MGIGIEWWIFAAVTANSYVEGQKAKKKAEAAKDASKGMQFTVEGNANPVSIAYGRNLIGGVRAYHNVSSNYKHVESTNPNVKTLRVDIPAWEKSSTVWDSVAGKMAKVIIPQAATTSLTSDRNGSKNEFLFVQQTLCYGPINDVVTADVDSKPFNSKIYEHGQLVQIDKLGGSANQLMTANFPDRVNARFTHTAFATMVYRLNRDDPQYSGIPETQFYIEGLLVPNVTRSGSVGNYAYTFNAVRSYSNNPARCLLDYLTNNTYGRGLGTDSLDLESFYNAIVVCDTIVQQGVAVEGRYWDAKSITTRNLPLYECNIILDSSKSVRDNVSEILGTMGDAVLVWSGGKYKLQLQYPANEAAIQYAQLETISEDHVIRDTVNITFPSASTKKNLCTVKFRNEAEDFKDDSVTWPTKFSTLHNQLRAEDNNVPLEMENTYSGITDKYHALAKAEELVRYSRADVKYKFKMYIDGVAFEPGDIVKVHLPYCGITNETMKINEISFNSDNTAEIQATKFDWRVLAWNAKDNELVASRNNYDTSPPAPVTNITLSNTGKVYGFASGRLSWLVAAGGAAVNFFIVMAASSLNRAPDDSLIWEEVGRTATESIDIIGLRGGEYVFQVIAVGYSGKSAPASSDIITLANATLPAESISGEVQKNQIASEAIDITKFASSIRPVEIVAALPTLGNTEGRQAFFNGKLYRFTSGAWKSNVDASDLAGLLNSTQLDIAIGGGNLVANSSFERVVDADNKPNGSAAYNNANVPIQYLRPAGYNSTYAYGVKVLSGVPTQLGLHAHSGIVDNSVSMGVFGGWKPNTKYTLSFYAKKAGNYSGTPLLRWNQGPASQVLVKGGPITTSWQRYVYYIPMGAAVPSGGEWHIDFNSNSSMVPGDEVHIDCIQIEEGDVATAYSPMSSELLPGSITETYLSTDAVTAPKIAAGAIIAGKLAADSVSTNNLQAKSVTASKLIVASTTNAINTDPTFTDTAAWMFGNHGANVTFTTVADPISGQLVARSAVGGSSSLDSVQGAPASASKKYVLSCYVRKTADANGTFFLRFIKKNSAGATTAQYLSSVDGFSGVTTSWQKVYGEITELPNLTADSLWGVRAILNWGANSGYMEVQDLRIEEKTDGKLIVDGSIEAHHLAVDSVTAGAIQAGAVSTTELAAKSVTADKVVLRNTVNLVANPKGEFGTSGWSGATLSVVPASGVADTCFKQEGLDCYGEWFDVNPGETYAVALTAISTLNTTPNNKLGAGFRMWHTDGNTALWTDAAGTDAGQDAFPRTNTWNERFGKLVVPDGIKKMCLWIHAEGYRSGLDPVPWFWTNARVTRAASSELVVDGLIKANSAIIEDGAIGNLKIGKHIASNDWNGVVDANGVVTTPGTQGWVLAKGNGPGTSKLEIDAATIRGKLTTSQIQVGDVTVVAGVSNQIGGHSWSYYGMAVGATNITIDTDWVVLDNPTLNSRPIVFTGEMSYWFTSANTANNVAVVRGHLVRQSWDGSAWAMDDEAYDVIKYDVLDAQNRVTVDGNSRTFQGQLSIIHTTSYNAYKVRFKIRRFIQFYNSRSSMALTSPNTASTYGNEMYYTCGMVVTQSKV